MKWFTIGLALLSLLSGCSTLVPVPEAPEVDAKQANEAWARVRLISKVDRKSLKDKSQRLTSYVNAYKR